MLSHLDCIIFPDRCEVIEIIPSQRYVYPIFKNGNTSLYNYGKKNKCKVLINEQIQHLNNIDVILRDPQQRLKSGINTFIQTTLRDHPTLDIATVTWFAQNYLFLNRHYAPQFSWLLNLARYLNPDATINFLSMDQLDGITANIHKKPPGVNSISDELMRQLENISNNEMYNRIDQLLITCIGQRLRFDQLITQMAQQDPTAYDWVIGRSQRILKPTHVLS
jgi:hypothetical protein